jgi:thiamine-monophosphate kinase
VTGVPLGPGAEFDRVRAIAVALGSAAAGLGDDCAAVPDGTGTLLVSTDVSVEGVHFRLDWIALEEVGWRAAAAALSDLAASGAEPVGLLAAVVAPRDATDRSVAELMSGVAAAGAAVGSPVLGGDLAAGSAWIITVTVLGRAARPVSRHGARPGDGIWVTGSLGGARAALEAWRRGEVPTASVRRAFARPEPRINAGRWLADHAARAMLDLSDGLAGDASHLAAASAVGLEIELRSLPRAPAVGDEARRLGIAAESFAAEGGEDYELLVAMPAEFGAAEAAELRATTAVPLTRIGRVVAGDGVVLTLDGKTVTARGYDHFR